MTMQVLQNKLQISDARQELIDKGASFIDSPLSSAMRKLGLIRGVKMGDLVKSWDVLSTINFLDSHVKKHEPILDIGCYASEVIVALSKLNYSNLTGADLNTDLEQMPCQGIISYETTNFMHTPFADSSFKAITSISVIEHGFDGEALLKEMSRLLQSGGYFIASFDYWPEKVDTTGINIFDMTWTIFSKKEILEFINEAARYDLFPLDTMIFEGKEKVINCGGKQYTFAWLVLEKRA